MLRTHTENYRQQRGSQLDAQEPRGDRTNQAQHVLWRVVLKWYGRNVPFSLYRTHIFWNMCTLYGEFSVLVRTPPISLYYCMYVDDSSNK